MPFKAIPWQRNLLSIPKKVQDQLAQIEGDLVTAAVTKLVRPSELQDTYSHLTFPEDTEEPRSLLPEVNLGKYSDRNRNGWEHKRTDLPKISKTFYFESPNFGDAARNGTHTHYQSREVYPVEYHEPRMWELKIELMQEGRGDDSPDLYKFSVQAPLDRAHPHFENDLLFALNLLQENVGAVSVFSAEATREDYIRTQHLDWVIFPPGEQDEVVRHLVGARALPAEKRAVIEERVRLFHSLRPVAFLRGSGGLSSYVGAKYADDLVVFENMNHGNALYVLFDNWEEVSRRSRSDLIREAGPQIYRIVHTHGWQAIFKKLMQREKRKRRL